ncbi:MAG: hypothetical protein WDN69_09850, partial [Aliidongia sp.]
VLAAAALCSARAEQVETVAAKTATSRTRGSVALKDFDGPDLQNDLVCEVTSRGTPDVSRFGELASNFITLITRAYQFRDGTGAADVLPSGAAVV